MSSHVPMCLYCGQREIHPAHSLHTGEGYCSLECSLDAADAIHDRAAPHYTEWDVHEAFREAELSRYDDDPNPYLGNHSED